MDDKFEKTFDECFAAWQADHRETLWAFLCERSKLCESPIEKLLMIGLVLVPPYFCTQIAVGSADSKTDTFDEQEDSFVLVRPQAMVGHYRVDFLVTVKFHAGHTPIDAIVIECDGHDFHERTKEQAARDKRRDRFLALRGLRVLRFTGGEIHKNAYGCASEVMDCLYDIWERQAK